MEEQKVSSTAARLNEIMQKRKLRQIDIVNMCQPYCNSLGEKIGKNHINQYVRGKNDPSQKKLTIIALALNVNEPWLMGYDVSPERDAVVRCEPMITPSVPGMDIFDQEPEHSLLVYGIGKLNREEAQKLLDVARVIFPGKFEWGEEDW